MIHFMLNYLSSKPGKHLLLIYKSLFTSLPLIIIFLYNIVYILVEIKPVLGEVYMKKILIILLTTVTILVLGYVLYSAPYTIKDNKDDLSNSILNFNNINKRTPKDLFKFFKCITSRSIRCHCQSIYNR